MVLCVCRRLKGSTGILRFLSPPKLVSHRARMTIAAAMSSATSSNSINPALTTSPWLMLPPKSGYNRFYNLAENREEMFGVQLPESDDAVLVGSSHGWLAFFNRRNNHVFLSNPLSGRLLKLPPIHTLPDPHINLRNGRGTVSKLILSSSSPEHDDDCRAMISYGPGDRLAFCSPSRSEAHWTPIGDLFFPMYDEDLDDDDEPALFYGRAYEDFVYCTRKKLFSCITEFRIDFEVWEPHLPTALEDWDLGVDPPKSRVCGWLATLQIDGEKRWLEENKKLLQSCAQIPYVVHDEQNKILFVVTRFVHAYKTVGFSALRVDFVGESLVGVKKLNLVDSLDGLAVFVGLNHSFSVSSPAKFGLKPNSIYFTDAANACVTSSAINGHDIGIFDYENKTVSPCPGPSYCDADYQTLSTPVWYTPSW